MNIVLWVVAALTALVFGASGWSKLSKSREELQARGMTYVEEFSDPMVKVIGALELLGAVGLVLPALTNIAPTLVPLSALGLVFFMGGAITIHLRRGEYSKICVNLLLLAMAAVVVVGRFGPWAFAG